MSLAHFVIISFCLLFMFVCLLAKNYTFKKQSNIIRSFIIGDKD